MATRGVVDFGTEQGRFHAGQFLEINQRILESPERDPTEDHQSTPKIPSSGSLGVMPSTPWGQNLSQNPS